MAACQSRMPLIVAHRGASHDAPENTLAAFDLAWQQGADLIEGDFHLSADGIIVCHHDETTEKTAGLDRPVAGQTLEELRKLDVGAWKDVRWTGERLATLAEVLRTVPADRAILIEIKTGPEIVPALLEVMEASQLAIGQMIVIAFDENVVAAIERHRPEITTYWLSGFEETEGGKWTPSVDQIIAIARRSGTDGVDLNANLDVIDRSFVRAVRAAALDLHVWTVNDADVARRLMRLGVDSITTDRPAWLREQLKRE